MTSGLWPSIRASLDGVFWKPAGVFISVDGTVYPGAPYDFPPPGAGFSSGIAHGLINIADGMWLWEGVGYPAAVTPMWPSVQIGRGNVVARIKGGLDSWGFPRAGYPIGTKIVLSGYSQGAMVTDQVWVKDCLDPSGVLHDRYLNGDILRIYNFGDPFRSPGIAHGNELAGTPMPTEEDGAITGGIGGVQDLRANESNIISSDGRPVLNSFARDGDIYACCPIGDNPWKKMAAPGKVGNSIFKIIMQATFLDVVAVAGALGRPVGMVQEIINGIQFAAAGTTAPHWQYWTEMDAAIREMASLGNQILTGNLAA